jgi:hypothetical protein
MDRARFFAFAALAGLLVACSAGRSGPRRDGGDGADAPLEMGCTSTEDVDADGIADQREGTGDADGDGVPNVGDVDSDNDGIADPAEARSSNPCAPRDSDGDGVPDFVDTDSDNDGIPDAEETGLGTDPTVIDTDGDGISDLAERAAGTSPTDPTSTIPSTDFFVVLPYNGGHELRPLRFGTNIQQADVFFLIDTTGSMQGAIDDVNSSLMTIVARVASLVADAQFGVGSYEDFPISPYGETMGYGSRFPDRPDWPFHLDQEITNDLAAVNRALNLVADGGNDWPESGTEALFQTATGAGVTYPGGSVPARSCPMIPDEMGRRRGYPCFRPGSLPIIVLVTDADIHNGPAPFGDFGEPIPYSGLPTAATYGPTIDALNAIGARVIGVDIATARNDLEPIAVATGTVDASGTPLVYGPAPASSTSDQIITGITTLVGGTPQDVSTTTENVAGNPDGFDARLFIKSITPVEGYAPDGRSGPIPGVTYTSRDATTFYNVIPGCDVDFQVDFWNDVRPPAATAQIFQARIIVLGNGVARLDERRVYIVVPPEGGTILI